MSSKGTMDLKSEVKEFCGHDIRVRTSDGYINATDMCKVSNKKFNDYSRYMEHKAFIKELSRSTGYPVDLLVHTIRDGPNDKRGTWVHPRVAIHLAQWISASFAVKVTDWVKKFIEGDLSHAVDIIDRHGEIKSEDDNILVKELTQKIRNMSIEYETQLREKNGIIEQRECKIDQLLNEIKETRREMAENAKRAESQRYEMTLQLKNMQEELVDGNDQLTDMAEKMEIVCNDRVPTTFAKETREIFLVMDLPGDQNWHLYISRTQLRGRTAAIRRVKRINRNSKILLEIDYQPNGSNLYLRIKEEYKEFINYFCNKIMVLDGNIPAFINLIRALHNTRFNEPSTIAEGKDASE